ncbi:MAG: UDP-N-acetylglucosamine 1-carboxyvinyltransferase [Saprospiraceae bacterium]|nr:UDP-N-acetylglucosamine 1-carboxyvinyltransferase [Saprospiraceae bacterium]
MATSESFIVQGQANISGSITPQGAKNEALQVICATMLTGDKVTLTNVPNIKDVNMLISLLEGLGVVVEKLSDNSYMFQAKDIDLEYLQTEDFVRKASKIRGSVMLIGPLLARFGVAVLPKPGGDKIGRRRIDTHLLGLQKLGAAFNYDEKNNIFTVKSDQLQGTYILMDEISVTGTANVVMAATCAKGMTTIYNAACEPYLQQLCKMLNSMGARITGVGSNRLVVEGVGELFGTGHRLLPDMIEIGSFLGLAAMTQSELRIKNVRADALGNILPVYRRFGINFELQDDDIFVPAQDVYEIQSFIDGSIMNVYDSPWPGFPPDLMSILLVVATQARGSVLIHQKMFESRLFFVDKLIDMGAQIILCDPHRATVIGLDRKFPLKGIRMTSPDIRAGVSLLIAALSAKGQSIIHQIHQIDRGYENIDGRLNALGAQIERVKD